MVRVRSFIDGSVMRHVTIKQAREMCAEDSLGDSLDGVEASAVRLSRKKAPFTDIKLLAPEREEKNSPCTLTMGDMLNNGIGSVAPELRKQGKNNHIGNYIDRAMTKVEHWPFVGDTKAVRVGPLGVTQPA